ncbi:hypothetical protein AMJ48_01210 [Parcubacteria bacterium DG_74_1]|nr:MAG: hypothetical protein AMJ48_01210 [Parcubacteria bacterium DG_74_1]
MNKKFAVIGKGFIYNLHAQAISQVGGDIASVVDVLDGPDTWREMVKKTEADCVVILAPNHLHFEMAKFSAEYGKIVLCEKPLALRSEEIKILAKYPNIFTVFQLRYHPAVKKIKTKFKEDEQCQIEIDISVHRDENYWKSWKGIEEKSGGIIFNLGIHYFDLLLYLFGEPTEILTKSLSYKTGRGEITGENYSCNWQISAEAPRDNQRRLFKVNGVNYDFAAKENLHFYVYKDLLEGRGIAPPEALKSIKLIEKIYEK